MQQQAQTEQQQQLQYDHQFIVVVTGDSGVGKSALLQKFKKPNESWEQMDQVATIGVDYVRRPLRVADRQIMLQTWDTAGHERFKTITTSYYRSAMGAIICYDCTSSQSLKSLHQWVRDFREKARLGAPILIVACKEDLARKVAVEAPQTEEQPEQKTRSDSLMLPAGSITPQLLDSSSFNGSLIVCGEEEELKLQDDDFEQEQEEQRCQEEFISQGRSLAKQLECGFIAASARTGRNVQATFKEMCRMILVAQGHLEGALNQSGSQVKQLDQSGESMLTQSMRLGQVKQQDQSKKKQKGCCKS